MNHRLEMKAESTSSDLKDRGQAMNGHLPAHQTPRDCINRHPWENWFTRCIVQYIKGTTVGSVSCNHLKGYLGATSKSKCYGLWRALGLLQHGNNRPHTGYHCVVTAWQHYATYRIPLCCYSMAALCHILDTIVLLQHGSTMPYTGYHCFVTAWYVFEPLKDALGGRSDDEEQNVFLKWLGMQAEVYLFLWGIVV